MENLASSTSMTSIQRTSISRHQRPVPVIQYKQTKVTLKFRYNDTSQMLSNGIPLFWIIVSCRLKYPPPKQPRPQLHLGPKHILGNSEQHGPP